MPTELPSSDMPGMQRETRQQSTDKHQTNPASLLSSKEDVSLGEPSKADHATNLRNKRLFFNLGGLGNLAMMASPVTSYVIVPTTILKTVTLGDTASVLCIPSGYAQC